MYNYTLIQITSETIMKKNPNAFHLIKLISSHSGILFREGRRPRSRFTENKNCVFSSWYVLSFKSKQRITMHDCGQTYCFGAGEWKRKHKKGQAITAVEGKNNSRTFSSFFFFLRFFRHTHSSFLPDYCLLVHLSLLHPLEPSTCFPQLT